MWCRGGEDHPQRELIAPVDASDHAFCGGRVSKEAVLATLSAHEPELRARGVRHLVLFGSVARGAAGPTSDVDLAVEFDRPVGLFALVRLRLFLEDLLGHGVDLVPMDGLRPEVRSAILREGLRAA